FMPTQATIDRRYWDSSCFIALLNDEPEAQDCERILDDAREGKTQIVVGPIVLVEVVRPRGTASPLPREIEQKIREFFENEYIKWRNFDRRIAEVARELCWSNGLHPRDAIHVATAIETKCDLVETLDPRILACDGHITGSAIRIVKPHWVGQLLLGSLNP